MILFINYRLLYKMSENCENMIITISVQGEILRLFVLSDQQSKMKYI